MKDEKLNNELDDFFRKELENLPEEKPSAYEWERMNKRIHSEGLLENNSNGRKYFLLILLLVLLSGLVSLPFLTRDENTNTNTNTNNQSIKPVTIATPGPKKTEAAENTVATSESISKNTKETYFFADAGTKGGNDSGPNILHGQKRVATGTESQETAIPAATDQTDNSLQAKNDVENETASASGATAASGQADEKITVADTANAAAQELTAASQNDSTSAIPDNTSAGNCSPALKRFRLGFYVSLDHNYYSLKENSNVAQAEPGMVRQSDFIEGESGGQYTIGVMAGYLFTQKLSLEAGAFYSQKKKLHADIYTPAYSSSTGEEMFSDFSYDFNARYFELYGRVKYYFCQKKNSFYTTLGATAGYNLPAGNDSSDYFSRTSYGESKAVEEHVAMDASSVNLMLVVSAGIEIPLGTRWDVYVEPAYKYSVTPVVKHSTYDRIPIEHFLRSVSLATGLMYKF